MNRNDDNDDDVAKNSSLSFFEWTRMCTHARLLLFLYSVNEISSPFVVVVRDPKGHDDGKKIEIVTCGFFPSFRLLLQVENWLNVRAAAPAKVKLPAGNEQQQSRSPYCRELSGACYVVLSSSFLPVDVVSKGRRDNVFGHWRTLTLWLSAVNAVAPLQRFT